MIDRKNVWEEIVGPVPDRKDIEDIGVERLSARKVPERNDVDFWENLAKISLRYIPDHIIEEGDRRRVESAPLFIKGRLGEIQEAGYRLKKGWGRMQPAEAIQYLTEVRRNIVRNVRKYGVSEVFRKIAEENRELRRESLS